MVLYITMKQGLQWWCCRQKIVLCWILNGHNTFLEAIPLHSLMKQSQGALGNSQHHVQNIIGCCFELKQLISDMTMTSSRQPASGELNMGSELFFPFFYMRRAHVYLGLALIQASVLNKNHVSPQKSISIVGLCLDVFSFV